MSVMKICERCGKPKRMMSWERTCFQCMKEEDLERIQEAIAGAGPEEAVDTWSDDYVICPYCGEALETDVGYEDFQEIYEEGSHKLDCPECGREFILNTHVSYSWDTEKAPEACP